MSRGVSDRARRRAALAFLTVACLAPLPAARGAVHAYGHDAFVRVGDAFLFYAGREGMLRGTTTRATTGETLRGVNDGRSYVQLNDVVFVRAEEAASHHAGAEGGAVTGAVEAIFCILAIRDQIVPPTLNLHDPDEGTEGVDLVPLKAKKREVEACLNNSFGFGGTNASLIVKKVD